MTVSAQLLDIIIRSKTYLMFSGRTWPGPTGRRTYSTCETPAHRDRERVLNKVKQKGGMRKNKEKEKKHRTPPKFDSTIAPALDV